MEDNNKKNNTNNNTNNDMYVDTYRNGSLVYPKTKEKAITDINGVNLKTKLLNFKKRIENLEDICNEIMFKIGEDNKLYYSFKNDKIFFEQNWHLIELPVNGKSFKGNIEPDIIDGNLLFRLNNNTLDEYIECMDFKMPSVKEYRIVLENSMYNIGMEIGNTYQLFFTSTIIDNDDLSVPFKVEGFEKDIIEYDTEAVIKSECSYLCELTVLEYNKLKVTINECYNG